VTRPNTRRDSDITAMPLSVCIDAGSCREVSAACREKRTTQPSHTTGHHAAMRVSEDTETR
jgi:hypothetical protein